MEIASTSCGTISFKKDGYIGHEICNNLMFSRNQIKVYHKDFDVRTSQGVFTFISVEAAQKASKELIESLKK